MGDALEKVSSTFSAAGILLKYPPFLFSFRYRYSSFCAEVVIAVFCLLDFFGGQVVGACWRHNRCRIFRGSVGEGLE